MAQSLDFDATAVPRAVDTILSLDDGVLFWVQNVDPIASLRFRTATAAPASTDRAHIISSGGSFYITPDSVAPIWLWTDDGTCAVIVSQAE